jgi:hypothetical protein
MLPNKNLNIYPKSKENVDALLHHYFAKYDLQKDEASDFLLNTTSLYLNQSEFICRKLSEAWPIIFEDFFGTKKTTLKNLLRYGIDGLTKNEKDWTFGPTSKGIAKIKEFINFVKETE